MIADALVPCAAPAADLGREIVAGDVGAGGAARPADLAAFGRDLAALRREIDASIGPDDLAHLKRLERWSRLCSALGYATAWIAPNPISALLMAHGNTTRWAIVAHHVAHRGYERVAGVPARYRGRSFAAGWRRVADWLDWIHPEAWRREHNALHHVHTGAPDDPDIVERNVEWLRRSSMPRPLKWVMVALIACTWKLIYYAPLTFRSWRAEERRRGDSAPPRGAEDRGWTAPFNPFTAEGRAFLATCVLPYAAVRFAVLPALFAPLGLWAVFSVLANSLLAELFANVESFFLITPNHAGPDLPRFEGRAAGRDEGSWRQIAGTVNYSTAGRLDDFLHCYLNYHIEHHLWPDVPVSKYRQYQPRLVAICREHGVPYRQESVLKRARRLLGIMMGDESMCIVRDP